LSKLCFQIHNGQSSHQITLEHETFFDLQRHSQNSVFKSKMINRPIDPIAAPNPSVHSLIAKCKFVYSCCLDIPRPVDNSPHSVVASQPVGIPNIFRKSRWTSEFGHVIDPVHRWDTCLFQNILPRRGFISCEIQVLEPHIDSIVRAESDFGNRAWGGHVQAQKCTNQYRTIYWLKLSLRCTGSRRPYVIHEISTADPTPCIPAQTWACFWNPSWHGGNPVGSGLREGLQTRPGRARRKVRIFGGPPLFASLLNGFV
jgi:hypothetical protein